MYIVFDFFLFYFFFQCYRDHRYLHSFPTRRSSDLVGHAHSLQADVENGIGEYTQHFFQQCEPELRWVAEISLVEHHLLRVDRKSTRLNSSHLGISYAVFCLKKKKKIIKIT